MLRAIILALVCVIAGGFGAAHAQDAALRRLDTGEDSKGWEGVGRLDVGGKPHCTAALIAPDLVLTAAHCLFDKRSGERIDPVRFEFRAGWRNGRAEAYRAVKRAVVHPEYLFDGQVVEARVRNDVALLQLQQPIRNTTVIPFGTDERPGPGAKIGIVSYGQNREDAPSLQEVCSVIARQQGILVMSCSVEFGSSGSPVFSFGEGAPRIVSVVSAKADVKGQSVALGTQLLEPLAVLKAELARAQGAFPDAGGAVVKPGERRATGAKFVTP